MHTGLHDLDAELAAQHLFAGRCLGICTFCGADFRLPPDSAEWPAITAALLRHGLMPGASEEHRQLVESTLSSLRDPSPAKVEAGMVQVAEFFADHPGKLAAAGAVGRVRRDG